MLLRLSMHVRRADGDNGRPAVADFIALAIDLLAQRLRQELDVPLGNRLHVVAVRHHDLDVSPILLGSDELQDRIEHRRILPYVVRLACLVHRTSTREERFDVEADAGRERQPDLGEDREASAHAVGHGKRLPALVFRELLQKRRLLFIRIGHGDNFDLDIRIVSQCLVDYHEVRHRVKRAARLRDHEEHHAKRTLLVTSGDLRLILERTEKIARRTRVNVVAAEIDLRKAAALFFRPLVPVGTALYIEKYLVAEIGAADPERDDGVRMILDMRRQFFQARERGGRVQMPVGDIRQLGEEHLFGRAVLRQMAANDTCRAHDLHRLMRLLHPVRHFLDIGLCHLARAIEIIVVKKESRLQLQPHRSSTPMPSAIFDKRTHIRT